MGRLGLVEESSACSLRIREVSAWNLTPGEGSEGDDDMTLPAPAAPVGDPVLLTRTPQYLNSSYFLPLALGPGAGTPAGDR